MTTARHPMAEFLTDEMRARVGAVTFESVCTRGFLHATVAKVGYRWCCPLAVALGIEGAPEAWCLRSRFNISEPSSFMPTVRDFISQVDHGEIGPDDVKAALGCEL